jgi:hypothetical protein
MAGSWLPRVLERAGLAAGLSIGLMLALAGGWLLGDAPLPDVVLALGVLLAGLLGSWRLGPRLPAMRFAVIAIGLSLVWAWRVA